MLIPDLQHVMYVCKPHKGFERLFEQVDDMEIDVPGATSLIAAFLSRALVDGMCQDSTLTRPDMYLNDHPVIYPEILPPSFLSDPVVSGLGGEVVAQTKRMLSRDHQFSRVERIWGPGDGRSVPELKTAIDAALTEYLMSKDEVEAERCVRELRVPHFHHELVKRAIVLVMDKAGAEQSSVGVLIKHLMDTEVLSSLQLQQGFRKVHHQLSDLSLDAPCAPGVLDFFVQCAVDGGLVPADFGLP
jgi:programmed cell death protein 4